ncbi:MATE efflux family protein 3, chloroplastic [Apostasia shenzhenica]|uniref:MATE efflux family protein 3, chloroplastic n=1 Tax=Apostasia shenzhenica TaxID=1088818 RepID=A0A2H9ZX12_9ASPA|nr:MATE efflux family protein 3, chloroplastic [Apostasia shenzhenica]
MRAVQQGGPFLDLRTGSCDGKAKRVGSFNNTRNVKNRVFFEKIAKNSFLSTGDTNLFSSSLSQCRKRVIPLLCNQPRVEYDVDLRLHQSNGHPSGCIPEGELKGIRSRIDELHPISATKELTALVLPAIVGQALDPFAQLLETAFIGRLDGNSAEEYHDGKKISEGHDDKLKLPSVSTALLLAAVIGVVEALALFIGAGILLTMMGVSSASPMRRPALQFLSLRAFGAPAVVVSLAIQGVFRGFKDTKTPVFCVGKF